MAQILITRALAQAKATAAALAALGHSALLAPLLSVEAVSFTPPAEKPQAILVTSANAIAALAGLDKTMPVYAVGGRTAELIRQAGFNAVRSADGDAAALAALVVQHGQPGAGALLHLHGDVIRQELAAHLGAAGFWVEGRLVYRIIPATQLPEAVRLACAAGQVRHVLLYSPRSASTFDRLVGQAPWREQLCLHCLSENVALAAGTGWKELKIAAKPDEPSLLETLPAPEKPV